MMNNDIDELIRHFLAYKPIDEYWCNKVINSVKSIDTVFKTQISIEDIRFDYFKPNQLWVNCDEEVDIGYADVLEKELSLQTLAPITVIEYRDKDIIYLGSVRAILFCRFQHCVDCIIVRLDTDRCTSFYSSAYRRLIDFDIYRRRTSSSDSAYQFARFCGAAPSSRVSTM